MFNCNVMGFVEQHESNASYTTVESVSKPNISAPYSVDIPNIGTRNGTSFATPQVTGVLALLFQARSYAVWPEKTHAAISATATEIYGQTRDYANFDDRVGAGIINLDKLLNIKGTLTCTTTSSHSSQSEVSSRYVTLEKNKTIKAVLFWLVRFESNTLYCTIYDLYLYDSNNNRVATSSTASNNAEMIIYKAPSAGNYRLVIYQYGSFKGNSGTDWIALAYHY